MDDPEVCSSFTYQGNLEFNGEPANGVFYFRFSLFDLENNWLGAWYSNIGPVTVVNGIFTTEILMGDDEAIAKQFWADYGLVAKTMLIEVGEIEGFYTALFPRVELTATPHAQIARIAHRLTFPYTESFTGYTSSDIAMDISVNEGTALRLNSSNLNSPALLVDGNNPAVIDFVDQTALFNDQDTYLGLVSVADGFSIVGYNISPSGVAGVLGQVGIGGDPNTSTV